MADGDVISPFPSPKQKRETGQVECVPDKDIKDCEWPIFFLLMAAIHQDRYYLVMERSIFLYFYKVASISSSS